MAHYIGVTKHKMNKENPFMDELFEMEVSTRTKIVAGNREAMNNLVVDKNSGDVIAHQMFAVKQKVDKEQFTKIFNKGLAAMWGLSSSGIKLFTFIASIVKPNQDFIYFEISQAKEFTGYKTDKSIMQGLGELLAGSFIARSDVHYKYYINPTFFFNGNRLTLVSHYEIDPKLDLSEDEKKKNLKNDIFVNDILKIGKEND